MFTLMGSVVFIYPRPVTHEFGFTRDVASWLSFIDGGTIAVDGSPDILLNTRSNPRLKECLQHVS